MSNLIKWPCTLYIHIVRNNLNAKQSYLLSIYVDEMAVQAMEKYCVLFILAILILVCVGESLCKKKISLN